MPIGVPAGPIDGGGCQNHGIRDNGGVAGLGEAAQLPGFAFPCGGGGSTSRKMLVDVVMCVRVEPLSPVAEAKGCAWA